MIIPVGIFGMCALSLAYTLTLLFYWDATLQSTTGDDMCLTLNGCNVNGYAVDTKSEPEAFTIASKLYNFKKIANVSDNVRAECALLDLKCKGDVRCCVDCDNIAIDEMPGINVAAIVDKMMSAAVSKKSYDEEEGNRDKEENEEVETIVFQNVYRLPLCKTSYTLIAYFIIHVLSSMYIRLIWAQTQMTGYDLLEFHKTIKQSVLYKIIFIITVLLSLSMIEWTFYVIIYTLVHLKTLLNCIFYLVAFVFWCASALVLSLFCAVRFINDCQFDQKEHILKTLFKDRTSDNIFKETVSIKDIVRKKGHWERLVLSSLNFLGYLGCLCIMGTCLYFTLLTFNLF